MSNGSIIYLHKLIEGHFIQWVDLPQVLCSIEAHSAAKSDRAVGLAASFYGFLACHYALLAV